MIFEALPVETCTDLTKRISVKFNIEVFREHLPTCSSFGWSRTIKPDTAHENVNTFLPAFRCWEKVQYALRVLCSSYVFKTLSNKMDHYTVLLILIWVFWGCHSGVVYQEYRILGASLVALTFQRAGANTRSACSCTTAVTTNSHCCIEQQWLCRRNLSAYRSSNAA